MPFHRGSPSLLCSSLAPRSQALLWLKGNLVLVPGRPMSPGHKVQLNTTPLALELSLPAWYIPRESAAPAPCVVLRAGCALGQIPPPGHPPGFRQDGGSPGCCAQQWYSGTHTGELCHGPRAQDVTCRCCGGALQGTHAACTRLVGCTPPRAHCVPVCVQCTHHGVCVHIHTHAHASRDYD